jgi:hypothetical protein
VKRAKKRGPGRPSIGGHPLSITLTDEQREWIDSRLAPAEPRTVFIRRLIQEAMERDKARKPRG